jgi:hypothetical protein
VNLAGRSTWIIAEPRWSFAVGRLTADIAAPQTLHGAWQQGRSSPLGKVWQLPYLDFLQKIAYMYASMLLSIGNGLNGLSVL